MNANWVGVFALIASAYICGNMIKATDGERGIGWFVFCLFLVLVGFT